MADRKLSLLHEKSILELPIKSVDKLISAKDGSAALLYLYMMRQGRYCSISDASEALGMSEAQLDSAYSVLISSGLAANGEDGEDSRHSEKTELPQYTLDDVNNELKNGSEFRFLSDAIQKALGRILSSDDLLKLFGIYDYLGLPPEVILTLVNFVVDDFKQKYNGQRRPTMRTVESRAFEWEREGICTLELAEAKIKYIYEKSSFLGNIKTVLGINGRQLTSSEEAYITGWLDMGFPVETIALAYDRTVLRTGKLTWKYMDTILKSWKSKNLIKPEEVENEPASGKVAIKKGNGNFSGDVSVTSEDMMRMRQLIDEMNGGKNNE